MITEIKVTRVTAGLTHIGRNAETLHNITLKCEFTYDAGVDALVEEVSKQLREYYAGCHNGLIEGNG